MRPAIPVLRPARRSSSEKHDWDVGQTVVAGGLPVEFGLRFTDASSSRFVTIGVPPAGSTHLSLEMDEFESVPGPGT
jgi:hypothetical protein